MAYVDLTDWTYATLGSSYSSTYNFLRAAVKLVYDDSASTETSYRVYAKVSANFSRTQTAVSSARMFYYENVTDAPSYSNYKVYKDLSMLNVSGNIGETYYWSVGTIGLGQTATSSKFRCGWFGNGDTVGNAFTNNAQVSYNIPSALTLSFSTTPQSGGGAIPAIANISVPPTLTWNTSSNATVVTYTSTLPSATSSDSNYTFIGWTVDGVDYNAGVTVTLTEDTTAYPRFSRNAISFSISVNGTVTQYTDQSIGSTITPTIPSGYTLAGWMLGVSNTWVSAPTITGGTVTVDGDWAGQTLCAVFSFTFTYSVDSSTDSDVKYAQRKLDSYLRAQPYKLGYMFNGWAKTGGSTYQGGALYPIADLGATQTFTAQWLAASWVPVLMFKKTTAS